MPGRFAKVFLTFLSLGALCLWSDPAQSRFGGGGFHGFGGGFRGFGGGGFRGFGGGGFRGFGHFGGMRFGGMRFGGRHFGGMRFGGPFAHRAFSQRGPGHLQRHAFVGRHFAGQHRAGAVGRPAASHVQAQHWLAGRSNTFARAAIAGAGLHQVHGFSNFNHRAFNRNGFGDRAAWNRFNHRFPNHCCGFFGPVFWPFFLGDVFTAVLWPWYDYDPFWDYGSDYLLSSIFWAGYGGGTGYAAADLYDIYGNYGNYSNYGNQLRRSREYAEPNANGGRSKAEREPPGLTPFTEACGGLAPGVTSLPIGKIQREVQPTGDQLKAFEELKAAVSKAEEMIKGSCSNEIPLTPVKRLEVVEMRLNTMAGAVGTVKAPLSDFYDTLTAGQRQRLNIMRGDVATRGPRARTAGGNGLPALCSDRAAAFSQVPAQRIEETIRPTAQQRGAFDALKVASAKAAEQLRSSCPAQVPTGIMDRLQAVDARLSSMLSAVQIVHPALDEFYASLTDEQKARFNSWGEPQRQAGANSG